MATGDHSAGHHGHAGHDMGMGNSDPVEHRSSGVDGHLIHDGHAHHDENYAGSSGTVHNMMMSMWFHFGMNETILFEFWKTSEVGTLLASMIVIFLLSFLYEALKFYREHLYRKSFRTIQYNTVTVPVENGGTIKETQKTVQIAAQSLSVDPNFEPVEMTPIFISQGMTCSCPGPAFDATETLSMDLLSDETMSFSKKEQTNNNLINPTNSPSPACNMNFRKYSSPNVHTAYKVKMVSWMHTWQTVLHMLQVILSYLLMLIFMTYNVWLCIAVILGAGVGYFFFGWKKSLVVDITEHCH